ncbi:MAG: corrinoid protein [Bacteroidales bacterium]|jgi:corrinoid protein of di/trimethylamine methyltransferase|nr:corrinoid protein [Bacteroidales bacterium]MBR7027346.1 corrinoid protein [Bacteroidales bacterium]
MAEFPQLHDAILAGNLNAAVAVTKEAVEAGAEPGDLVNNYMIKAMEDIGAKFEAGQAYVPNLLMAARAMKGSLEILKPMMQGSGVTSMGKIVIATVKGDLHDIGKNLVASMLEGCGFEVINLGVDQSDQKIVDAVNQHHPDILALSALLTTTMGNMKVVIDALTSAGLRDSVKIMVGGAPISEAFAKEIGADGYSANANEAVALAKSLI